MNFFEKTINSKTVYCGKFFTVTKNTVILPNKKTATRELMSVNQCACCVVALTKSNKIVLVNQFRYALQKNLWEVPAGKQEIDEPPLNCAKRELLEETGFKSKHWIYIGKLTPCPATCTKFMHIFLAKRAFKACAAKTDPDEFVETRLFDFEKIVQKAASGLLTDTKTICSILKTNFLVANKYI